MPDARCYRSIGLMSGTSMDAIDVAFLETDGEQQLQAGAWASAPYPGELRQALLGLDTEAAELPDFEQQVTKLHIDVVRTFCSRNNIDTASLDCIGFHGQTIKHEP